jgi:uncharacterized protein YndB with AHSA1/START domain
MRAETRTADGIVTKSDDGRDMIAFERRLSHPIDSVWAALTDPDELIKWWGEARVELKAGGEFRLRWLNTDDEGNSVVLRARISELEPPRLLEITGNWTSSDAKGEQADQTDAAVRWELEPDGDATVLRFSNTFELPGDKRTMVPAGWHYHLDALATALEGGSVDIADPWAEWEPIHEAYLAKYGSAG